MTDSALDTDNLIEQLRDPVVHADPYPFYRRLREQGGMVRTPISWVATSHADATAILRDPRFSSNERHSPQFDAFAELAEQVGLGSLLELQTRIMLFADPPDHTRLRRLVSKAFHARAVEAMRPRIQALVDGILEEAAGDGGMDVTSQLAYPLPVSVICEMLGVPAEDRFRFEEWTRAAVRVLDPGDDLTVYFPAKEAFDQFGDYFAELLPKRRRAPGPDLLSALLAAEDAGDALTQDELVATIILLFIAGHETTVNLIGNGLLALLRHPEELARLRSDPTLLPSAVEELLRFDGPVQLTGRTATADLDVHGTAVPKGQQVVVLLGAANHDPAAFQDPERLDVGRTDNRHVAFGGGIHLCLGAPLARLEAQVALGTLVQRFPALALATEDVVWKETVTLRGPEALPVSW